MYDTLLGDLIRCKMNQSALSKAVHFHVIEKYNVVIRKHLFQIAYCEVCDTYLEDQHIKLMK